MVKKAFQEYFKELILKYKSGTEFTPRTPLENLLNQIKPDKEIKIIQEPKKEEGISGRPDFKVEINGLTVGYIETKNISRNLDEIVNNTDSGSRESEQLKKYLKVSSNLILTNYNEFILFRNGEQVDRKLLFYPLDKELDKSNVAKVNEMFKSFFLVSPQQITNPKQLSHLLAERTKLFRDFLNEFIDKDEENDFKSRLIDEDGLYSIFKKTLIEDLSLNEFIDVYVQTVTYGLFLAKLSKHDPKNPLTENNALKSIPKSMGVLKDLFKTIEIDDIPDSVGWIIDEIMNILNFIDIEKIKGNLSFSKVKNYEDPYVYFYENFLAEYDEKKRKTAGVYYTPIPVVWFIIESIDHILRKEFNKEGFVDRGVTALDFATGTGTFLLETFQKAINETDKGLKRSLIKEHLLKNFYGFEYLIAPYTIAHLKLSQFLNEEGYNLEEDERAQVYLTDTLDTRHTDFAFLSHISSEGKKANVIKVEKPLMVVMGNPPYNSRTKHYNEWILKRLESYKTGLNEKNIQPLNDDYIKFIRFAQWKIDKEGEGIVGIISNNSYLDGLIHRVMREKILESFDKIYILNLHGNKRKGDPDENVFDIMAGVNISLFIKLPEPLERKEVYYYSTIEKGLMKREDKYEFLLNNDVSNIDWIELSPKSPNYWFIEKDLTLEKEYNEFWGITEIFKEYNSGIQTRRDKFTLHFTKKNLKEVIKDLIDLDTEKIRIKYDLPADGRDWTIERAKTGVIEDLNKILNKEFKKSNDLTESDWRIIDSKRIKKVQYRPFDFRFTYFFNKSKSFLAYPTFKIMRHLIDEDNLGFIFTRQAISKNWKHCFITHNIAESGLISNKTREWGYLTPLYIHKNNNKSVSKQVSLTGLDESVENPFDIVYPYSNFTNDFKRFISTYPEIPSPEDVLGYIYAILYSNKYREKYNEFLKTDFPKVPFVEEFDIFLKLSKLGNKLIECHNLNLNSINLNIAKYMIEGNDIVDKINYNGKSERLFINADQFFDKVPQNVWNFEIGSYKVLDKWLKYRKGIKLSYNDIIHFQKVIRNLKCTISIMENIDGILETFLIN